MHSSENDETIKSYEQSVAQYAAATPSTVNDVLKSWLDASVKDLPFSATIFEIGSGTGRDALYLQSLGYTVRCSDATEAFRKQLRQNGLMVENFNVITDEFEDTYALILADAVLLHLTAEQTNIALKKIYHALIPDGRLALTLKEGEGTEWTDHKIGLPRYFTYWTEEAIRHSLNEAGFKAIDISRNGPTERRWLSIIARV